MFIMMKNERIAGWLNRLTRRVVSAEVVADVLFHEIVEDEAFSCSEEDEDALWRVTVFTLKSFCETGGVTYRKFIK